jgi:hypothetical protein
MKLIKSRFFSISELICPEILEVLTEEAAWRLIPYSTILSLDLLRSMYGGPIYINGKGLTHCGVRCKCTTVGAPKSRHKLYEFEATCFDLHCDGQSELRHIIEANSIQLQIDKVEDYASTPTWTHIQITTNPVVGGLQFFKP